MSRVTLELFVAAAASLAASSASAGCCGSCCSSGYATTYALVQPAPQIVAVQPAPVLVQVQQPPILVQQVAPVPQYVVNQGPVYAGPGLTDYGPAIYRAPRGIAPYPYVGHRWHGYRRAAWHHRPHGYMRRHHHHYHGHHAPLRRYY